MCDIIYGKMLNDLVENQNLTIEEALQKIEEEKERKKGKDKLTSFKIYKYTKAGMSLQDAIDKVTNENEIIEKKREELKQEKEAKQKKVIKKDKTHSKMTEEERKEYMRDNYEKHKEERKQKCREYYEKNRDRVLERLKNNYIMNREEKLNYAINYYYKNKKREEMDHLGELSE
jgi:hypothetical protein